MAVDPSAETEAERPKAPAASPLEPGAQLGKYKLERTLGAGGMGVVWAATDPDLERPVAIKLLRAADGSDTQRTRLLREARAMARLKHPNVLTVYEVGTAAGVDYIAMELVDGSNLGEWLAKQPPQGEVIAALLAAGRGLAAAHEAGIVHRDFKPENVLRDKKGHVYVTDFGLAFGHVEDGPELVPIAVGAVGSGRPVDSVLDSPLTQTGVLIGTPAYMAPEQFAGRAAGPRSDQFAFCVTAWEALTGERPFHGKNLDELRKAASAGVGRSAQLSPRVYPVLARGLSPDPEQRYADMPILLDELEQALGPQAPKRRGLMIGLGVAALAASLAIGAFALRGNSSHRGDCAPADEVFASAWGADRKHEILKTHPGGSIATFAVLDETRQEWKRRYQEACAKPASPERHEQLACLLEVRDEVASEVKAMADPGNELEITDVIGARASLEGCGGGGGVPVPPVPPIHPVHTP
jgi:predicted Ser/Thr protein kinase